MDLVGKIIRHGMANILILSMQGELYNCADQDTGKTFQALKSRYDEIFMPVISKVKKKGSKGKHISGTQYLGEDD